MNEQKFKSYMMAAKSEVGDYSRGYQRGLRRHYHGDNFGTDVEHEKYMALNGHRQEIGDGYRDGFEGLSPRGTHGNTGNQNAVGELPADTQLQIRLNSQLKASYVKQAQREGMKLSQWVIKTLSAATERGE